MLFSMQREKLSNLFVARYVSALSQLYILLINTFKVNAHSTDLRRNARIMDELDVTLGFANLATEMRFSRPLLKDE